MTHSGQSLDSGYLPQSVLGLVALIYLEVAAVGSIAWLFAMDVLSVSVESIPVVAFPVVFCVLIVWLWWATTDYREDPTE